MERTRIPLDRLTWTRWRRVVLDALRSEVGGRVKLLFGALLGLLLAINGLNVVNSYVGRDFMTAIEQRSMSGFLTLAGLYIGVFAVSTLTAVIYRFTEERLGLLWRHWMTRSLVDYYLHDAAYYRLRERAEVPNPDQRIADDVRTFTTTTLSLLLVWLNGTFTILAFSGVLWSRWRTGTMLGSRLLPMGRGVSSGSTRPRPYERRRSHPESGCTVSTDLSSNRRSFMKPFSALLLLLAVLAPPAVSLASAAELEWDQKRVAALAQDLIDPLEALTADLENRPAVSEKEALHAAILNDVKDLQLRVRELAQRLASGAGRAETDALFRQVQTLESRATKRTLEYPAPFDMHAYVDRVQRITIQLARYYGEASAGEGPRR